MEGSKCTIVKPTGVETTLGIVKTTEGSIRGIVEPAGGEQQCIAVEEYWSAQSLKYSSMISLNYRYFKLMIKFMKYILKYSKNSRDKLYVHIINIL